MVFSKNKSGSALLVTLLVISIMLAVVLAFTARVRMELRNVQTRIEKHEARSHAVVGLHLALDKLQVQAGTDQKATARANILGNGVATTSQHWTGVWERNPDGSLAANPTWLVSGSNPNPMTGAGSESFTIARQEGSSPEIRVAMEDFTDTGGNRRGQLAFWVSDEGSKASVSTRRGAIETYGQGSLAGSRRRVEFSVPFGVGLHPFLQNFALDVADEALARRLQMTPSDQSLLLVEDSSGNLPNPIQSGILGRETTLQSLGVLENAADGGLRRNLSDTTYRDDFLATEETARFLGPKGGVLTVESGLPTDRGVEPGEPYFSPRPLLTEAVLYIGLFHTWNDAKIRIRYHVQTEFLNPYTLPLEFPRDPDNNFNRALTVVFENLPTIVVEDTTPGSPTPPLTENLNEFSSYTPSSFLRDINSWVEISPGAQPHVPLLHPGETYRVMEPNPDVQPRGLARDFTQTRWSASAGTRPANNAQIRISASHPPGGVTLKGVPYQGTGRHNTRPIYFEWSGLNFDDFSILKTFNEGPNPFSRQFSGEYVVDDYVFAYHFRLYSDVTDPSSMRDFLSSAFIMDPDMDARREFVDAQDNVRTHDFLLDPISTSPPSIVADTINLFSLLDVFSDTTPRSHQPDYRQVLLVDVPDNDALSVGQLTHLPLYRLPLGLIGSPRGGDYNLAFDRYYFSPKRNHPDTGSPMLVSPALRPLHESPASIPNHTDAANELIEGAFNVNSTSEKAWESVLSSPILLPPAQDEDASGDQTRLNAFFRLPRYQALNGPYVVTREELSDPSNAFAQGVRTLHDDQGQNHVRDMAREIVRNLKNRGEPFGDLSAFVNSGILQNAIEAVPGINDQLFEASNVYLRQQDLLQKLAPGLSVRSDTFVIRAYGNVRPSGATSPTSVAICEAVVQRIPLKSDGSDPMTPSNSLSNHRKFEIISFRWLNEEDL